jgi:hypothetical protein
MSHKEREHPRFAVAASVVVYVEPHRQVVGRTTNLSKGGLCVVLREPVPAGGDFDVRVSLVFAEGDQSESVRLPVRTVWCTPVEREFQVGMAFRSLTGQNIHHLGVLLRYLESGNAK